MTEAIKLSGLTVKLAGRVILKDLTGHFSGNSLGLLGPNGAGKSTLIRTLLGFHQPAAGTAHVFGCDIRARSRALRQRIGYMPEDDSFIAEMSGIRFVRYFGELSGLPAEVALERAHEALFFVGLGEARYRKIGTYSAGMKQMIKLAQALVHGPDLIILDEPTNGLDPPARERMLKLIRDIRDAGAVKLVLSSHLLRDVEDCCQEVLILKDGAIASWCNLEEERRANRKFLELETRGDRQPFLNAVQSLGCECAVAGHYRMKVILPDGIEIRRLYELAAQAQIQIRRLNYKRDSLQDIFLKAMEGNNDNGRIQA